MFSVITQKKKKDFEKNVLDYLGSTYFNAMPITTFLEKKNIFFNVNKKTNYIINKNSLVKWLISKI